MRVVRMGAVLLAACGVLGLGRPAELAGQARGGAIAGRILEPSGGPITGAVVLVATTALGTKTSDDGVYRIERIPSWQIRISR
ncbi:MAG TPA: carboxypeptidase-like regulatory domain-containing protein, partial [Gemmatimonadales bacterium]|nr:carboxypeptidase-like regulatory domain-containing protein [Gemmatimonadales bacterium]